MRRQTLLGNNNGSGTARGVGFVTQRVSVEIAEDRCGSTEDAFRISIGRQHEGTRPEIQLGKVGGQGDRVVCKWLLGVVEGANAVRTGSRARDLSGNEEGAGSVWRFHSS